MPSCRCGRLLLLLPLEAGWACWLAVLQNCQRCLALLLRVMMNTQVMSKRMLELSNSSLQQKFQQQSRHSGCSSCRSWSMQQRRVLRQLQRWQVQLQLHQKTQQQLL
jgi:hypothetical protein